MINQEFINALNELKAIQDRCKFYETLHQTTRLADDLAMVRLIEIYDRIVEIYADIAKVNNLMLKLDHKFDDEVISTINALSRQRRLLTVTFNRNLAEQNIKREELLTVEQKNKIRNFRSLLKMATKRLMFNPSKEQIEKDSTFLQRKFNSLPSEGVDLELVESDYVEVINKLEDNL